MGNKVVPEFSKKFNDSHPNVSLSFTQNNSQKLLEALTDNRIDIAIVSQISGFDNIEFTPLLIEELVAVLPSNHRLKDQESISLKEIAENPIVYYEKKSGLRHFLDEIFRDAKLTPTPIVEVEEDHTILGFVSYGYGLAILPDIPAISAYDVVKKSINTTHSPRQIYIATRKADYIPPVVEEFKKFCLENIQTKN